MFLTPYRPRSMRMMPRRSRWFDEAFLPLTRFEDHEALRGVAPSVDIYEKDDALVIEADLPGIDKEALKVDVHRNVLTLAGERRDERHVEEDSRYRNERRYGKFERSFKLPFEVTEEHVNAVYQNGVLTLTVTKPEEHKPKEITVN